MPLDELAARVDKLPPDKLIVAYCCGLYCVYVDDALLLTFLSGVVTATVMYETHKGP